jgi:hypothetical protein
LRTSGGLRRVLLRRLTLVAVLTLGLAGAPAVAASAAAGPSIQALYAPLASVHLEPGTPAPLLSDGNWIVYEGTHFHYGDYVQVSKSRLIFQADGNLVLYDEVGRARWASGTDHRGQEAIFQQDGNLVVYVSRGDPFSSRTCCFADLLFSVRADGSLRIYHSGTLVIRWRTWTAH